MKNNILNKSKLLIIGLILSIASGLQAQDTLSADTLKSSYFYNEWYDFQGDCILMNTLILASHHAKEDASLIELGDNDTITIYGMAVGLDTYRLPINQNDLNSMCDTSDYEEAYELWGLYRRVADSLQRISPQLPVNIKLDTPTYYLAFNSYEDNSCTEHTRPLAVYELFFHNPIVIVGPFYMAMTNRNYNHNTDDCKREYYTWPIFRRFIAPSGQPVINQGHAYYDLEQTLINGTIIPAQWNFQPYGPFTFCFPIIAPPDSNYIWDTTVVAHDTIFTASDTISISMSDTIIANNDTTIIANGDTIFVPSGSSIVTETTITHDTIVLQDTAIVGGDTIVFYDTIIHNDTIISYDILLSIKETDILNHHVTVMPNPAEDRAKVSSSMSMNRIEAYTAEGTKVHDCTVSGLSTTIDVSHWPVGIYLLRIHTPMGTATKKLNIKR